MSRIQVGTTIVFRLIPHTQSFIWEFKELDYCQHRYNQTTFNERAIEISLAKHFLSQHQNLNILEVGAVLQHYQDISWPVVDKYEVGANIINIDILDFHPKSYFDLIISISTLEHIGQDEDTPNSQKPLEVIRHLQSLLSPRGTIAATFPIGYNRHLDQAIQEGVIPLNNLTFFKRISFQNIWKQVSYQQVKNTRYGWPFNNANGLVLLIINKK